MYVSPLRSRSHDALLIGPGRPLDAGSVLQGIAAEIAPALRQLNIDPGSLFRGSDMDPGLLDDEADALSHAALGRLLARCAARTACAHFGLLVGQRASIQSLGLLGRLMRHSETVGDALRVLVARLQTGSRGCVASLDVEDDTVVLSHIVCETDVIGADQIADGIMGCMINTIRVLCGPGWKPAEVLLPRAAPVDRGLYRHLFQAPVRFDQEIAAVVLSVRDLDLRIAGADPLLRTVLEAQLDTLSSGSSSELADDIRRMLRTRLASNRCSVDRVAGSLAMHRRTLSRHLSDEGTGFRVLANEVRFETACQLLGDTRIPLGQIAAALGYSEASAFTRAFRRWSGRTPTAWRAGYREGGNSRTGLEVRSKRTA